MNSRLRVQAGFEAKIFGYSALGLKFQGISHCFIFCFVRVFKVCFCSRNAGPLMLKDIALPSGSRRRPATHVIKTRRK